MRRLSITVPVSYDADTSRVIEMLNSVASAHPKVRAHPAPKAVLSELSDSARHFSLLCWVHTADMHAVRAELTLSIDRALREGDIRIPSRQTDVHLHFPEEQRASSAPG
jgi:small-conductance mechanosensitive channel